MTGITAPEGSLREDDAVREHLAWAGIRHRYLHLREPMLRWRRRQAQLRCLLDWKKPSAWPFPRR